MVVGGQANGGTNMAMLKTIPKQEIDSIFSDGDRWVREFSMANHPFQDDLRNGTKRAEAIRAWNQEVLKAEGVKDIMAYRGVSAGQVRQMQQNREGQYTWIGIRQASSWSTSRSIAEEHAGRDGAVVSGRFKRESSFELRCLSDRI